MFGPRTFSPDPTYHLRQRARALDTRTGSGAYASRVAVRHGEAGDERTVDTAIRCVIRVERAILRRGPLEVDV